MSQLTSSFTCQLISVIITTLIIPHSVTAGSKPTFSTNPSKLNTSSTLDCLHDHRTGPDLSCCDLLVFSLIFLFVPCGGLSWLHVSFLHCTLNTQYHIVVYQLKNRHYIYRGCQKNYPVTKSANFSKKTKAVVQNCAH